MKPDLCPRCLERNVVATVSGPTCPHTPYAANWWPKDWDKMIESERVGFVEDRRDLNTKVTQMHSEDGASNPPGA